MKSKFVVDRRGIEPRFSVCKTEVVPLDQQPIFHHEQRMMSSNPRFASILPFSFSSNDFVFACGTFAIQAIHGPERRFPTELTGCQRTCARFARELNSIFLHTKEACFRNTCEPK